ncbi:alpha-L-arabinofuranosidase [Lacihabitans sp. CCS-44]|uniref:alpha-L-arabinofuranosidase C-terminal domain-containing protein n=1 Tax=Lacihabitans sp. CCS-44 TaxID=2487331 RepID=UPI0020CDB10D|nr:alpha-L-arabinofuranosidase C-terminal domain-containing protein [Lacihabitans sp. CCS-44]MCP9755792.1 alpha-L-arabinofuranosidase [Lacihabitans sp. CCS-44]
MRKINLLIVGLFFWLNALAQNPQKIEIDATQTLVPIQPTMYGIFFEDINFGADGGLYAELIKNRSFEFEYPWMGWKHLPQAETRFNTSNELTIFNNARNNPTNPRVVRVEKRDASQELGLQNEGFDGIGLKKGEMYDFSAFVKINSGDVYIEVQLLNEKGEVIGSTQVRSNSLGWGRVEGVITASETVQKGKVNINFKGKGQLDIDQISLFPQDTWKGRKGGLRKDLVQLLADMKPGFVRFPGGCIVEGRTLAERYQWKKTVGKVENRELLVNRWNMEFSHRPAPDYYQTFGLGFFEYFQMCEDIGAQPLPILSCGLACQFNSSETTPLEDLDPFIQDAIDLIEFANGDVNSKWGALRAEMGHPQPFNLKMIGIGNEQWGQEYFERYEKISKAVKAKYPDVKLVSGTGPASDGELFEQAEKALPKLNAEIVDEHYYKDPKWFRDNAKRYDNYDRNRYKIFAGEYAAQSHAIVSPDNKNNWECALSEAAFMTGLERNADVVYMTSYAPLFAHVNRWQWTPDLIWFDNLTAFGTANYQVQKLYATNAGSSTLSIKSNGENLTGQQELYATAAFDAKTNEVIIKLVNTSATNKALELNIKGLAKTTFGKSIILADKDLKNFNTIDKPNKFIPIESTSSVLNGKTLVNLDGYTFQIIRIKK